MPPGQLIKGVAILASDPAGLASSLEVEQRKCARLITGNTRLTDKETLTGEAYLYPLSLRFKEPAAVECSHIIRPPPEDPVRSLLSMIPPWNNSDGDTARFVMDLAQPTRRTDPPECRKEAALAASVLVSDPYCTIWSDGSAKEGATEGGGGAILKLHREGRTIECHAPAGKVCSSMRAELVAMSETLNASKSRRPQAHLSRECCSEPVCRSGLQLLSRGPDDQQMTIAQRVWRLLDALTAGAKTFTLHWVPGHGDLTSNEAADRLEAR